jgi:hypothetical protein
MTTIRFFHRALIGAALAASAVLAQAKDVTLLDVSYVFDQVDAKH